MVSLTASPVSAASESRAAKLVISLAQVKAAQLLAVEVRRRALMSAAQVSHWEWHQLHRGMPPAGVA